ncbi:hypothetical protein GGD38_000093 [Chitinophagaceae bacterium OAS944]|nr:hypothetical protein [Chitinophagaceae bacterium OAS944]
MSGLFYFKILRRRFFVLSIKHKTKNNDQSNLSLFMV